MQGSAGWPFLLSDENESWVFHFWRSGRQDWIDTVVLVKSLSERLGWSKFISFAWVNCSETLVTLLWYITFHEFFVPAFGLTGNELFEVLCGHWAIWCLPNVREEKRFPVLEFPSIIVEENSHTHLFVRCFKVFHIDSWASFWINEQWIIQSM